jgi:CDP-2,3-bis-(O-geranylgeranyl)-sn-glycerol synthase
MFELILKSLYFFLPVYFANMAPVLFKWIPFASKPIYEKWFGKNKTWRGLIVATIIGTIVFLLQKLVYNMGFTSFALIDYNGFPFLLGALMGLGAILGDLVESYYKRKNDILPGKSWIPWDQLDFVIGGLVLTLFFYVPKINVIVILLLISPLLHVAFSYLGYLLKLKKDKF